MVENSSNSWKISFKGRKFPPKVENSFEGGKIPFEGGKIPLNGRKFFS